MTQTVEVDIGPTIDSNQRLLLYLILVHIFFHPSNRERTRRLRNGTGIIKDVFNRRTDLIGADQHHLIHQLFTEAKGLLADLFDGDTIRKNAYLFECDPTPLLQRRV